MTHDESSAFAAEIPSDLIPLPMAKSSGILDWCNVRLGEDHNWWVDEVSDPVRWDVDGLSIIDPRQVAHLIESVEPLRDYGFDQDVMDTAFIPFRIDKDLGNGKVRLKRVKDSIFESDEKLFALPDIVDEENGPFADLLDHLTRCRVKMLNDLFDFEQKLTVDEVEDEIREDQNAEFMEGKAIHSFNELSAILDYAPAGWDTEEEGEEKASDDAGDDADLPEIDEEDEKVLEGDSSLKWDEDEEKDTDGKASKGGAEGKDDDEDGDDDEEKEDDDEEDDDDDSGDEDKKPAKGSRVKKKR